MNYIVNRDGTYTLLEDILYHSKRYDKAVICRKGMVSDGATGAIDIASLSWVVHDQLCNTGLFADGSPCTNLQASFVLHDILEEKGHGVRKYTWFVATWLFGGGRARDNGLF